MAENDNKQKVEQTEVLNDAERKEKKEIPVDNGSEESLEEEVKDEKVSEEAEEEVAQEELEEVGETEKLKAEVQEAKDKYLRLYSEFENYRRRTAKERLDLIKTASEDLMVALLPILDDFERAQKAMKTSKDENALQEGFDLIYNKLLKSLTQKGLKPMEAGEGTEFNTEFHEAISQMPVEKKKLKGKVIDVVEKGYFLDEKVIRFAKVVIGA